jgi:hypothetical protein
MRLNTIVMDVEAKLNQLRMDQIGGVLMVTIVVEADGKMSAPFIMILTEPFGGNLPSASD